MIFCGLGVLAPVVAQTPIVQAPLCSVCSSSPAFVSQWVSLTNLLIPLLSQSSGSTALLGRQTLFGPWRAGAFGTIQSSGSPNIIDETVLGGIDHIAMKSRSSLATARLIGIEGLETLHDGTVGMLGVWQSKALMRDIALIQDLDSIYMDLYYAVGKAGRVGKTLDPVIRTQIQTLLDTYKKTNPDPVYTQLDLTNTADVDDVIRVVLMTNALIKQSIVIGAVPEMTGFRIHGTIYMLNVTGFADLVSSYTCTKGLQNQCTSTRADAKRRLANIQASFGSGGMGASIDQFKNATTKLSFGLGFDPAISASQRTKFLDREKDMLASYQSNRDPSQTRAFSSIQGLLGNATRQMSLYKDEFTSVMQNISSQKPKINSSSTAVSLVSPVISQSTQPYTTITTVQSLEGVMADEQIALASVAASDPHDILMSMDAMLQLVRLTNDTIYSPSNPNSIYENLAKTCELQCSNLGGRCR